MGRSKVLAKGMFLIATPDISKGTFFRGVILLCEHSPSGSFGLVINKPLSLEIPESIAQEMSLESISRLSIRTGGPVQTDQVMLLHDSCAMANTALRVADRIFLGSDLKTLRNHTNKEENFHLYFGYTGWGSDQLEREIAEGSWYTCPAAHRYIFEVPTNKLWQTLLSDMGGRFASIATMPEDIHLN